MTETTRCGVLPRMAVERWTRFPATADPRPTVLLDSPVRSEDGFTNTDAKIAFCSGTVESAEDVPDEPLRLLRSAGDGGFPPKLRCSSLGPSFPRRYSPPIVGNGLSRHGESKPTAALGPIWAVAETLGRCWTPPRNREQLGPHMLGSALVGADQRSLNVTFVGGREDLFRCDAEVLEATTAVTVVPLQRLTRELPSRTAITLEGHPREVRVVLREALGGRVLVNLDGSPIPVLSL